MEAYYIFLDFIPDHQFKCSLIKEQFIVMIFGKIMYMDHMYRKTVIERVSIRRHHLSIDDRIVWEIKKRKRKIKKHHKRFNFLLTNNEKNNYDKLIKKIIKNKEFNLYILTI